MKPFAIYFPQFYPIETNERVWGKGFTDWTLLATANLHDSWARRAPRRGLYDGADPAVHRAQIDEMREAGLGGLGLYHYWFYSHQELDAFERTMLALPKPAALPWFLIWASESWSRRWVGDPTLVVGLDAAPDAAAIEAHCVHLRRCFEHPSYFRWKGRPLFVWYSLGHFDDPAAVVARYRETLARDGLEIAVGQFVKNPADAQWASLCEVNYLFEPRLFFGMQRVGRGTRAKRWFDRVRGVVGERAAATLLLLADRWQQNGTTYPAHDFLRYLASPRRRAFADALPGAVQEVASPGWNNAPRYAQRFTALENLPPEDFAALLRRALEQPHGVPPLINAWNEWTEGAAVEPCHYLGTRYLDALATPAADAVPALCARPAEVRG